MKISQIKVMVCLEHFMLPYIPLLSFLFLSSSKNLKQFKVVCVNILKKLYLLDTEIIVGGNFLSSKIFKFSIWCSAQSPDFEISKSFTSYKFCPLQSTAGNCLTPLSQSVPIHSVEGMLLHILCLAVPVTIWEPICLPYASERVGEDPRGWLRTERLPGSRGSGTGVRTAPAGGTRHRELLLVLADKSGHRESQRKGPSVVRQGGRREGGGLLSTVHICCGMEGKKIEVGVADSFCGEGKVSVGHCGNGNRHSFSGWEMRKIILLLSHYMEKENIDVCLTVVEEVKTRAVCGDTTEKSRK